VSKNLVVLTIEYPEPLLVKEIPYLSEAFENVHIIYSVPPARGEPFPKFGNVKAIQLFTSPDFSRPIKLVLKHFLFISRIYVYTLLRKGNLWHYLKHYKSFLGYLLLEAEKVLPLSRYIAEHKLEEAIFYDYWLVDSTLALTALKKRGLVRMLVARAHGFDLYDDRQFESRVSFIEYRIAHLDKVFTICRHGQDYLRGRVAPYLSKKVDMSYLGISSAFVAEPIRNGADRYTVVSCASMIPIKRIGKIIDTLKLTSMSIEWIHFGDGPLRKSLELASLELPPNVRASFRGNVPNNKLLEFYSTNFVNVFVSLSESEGLPVSMMEAISFGIPILATSVNGVPEIVTEKTGVLVDKSANVTEVCDVLHRVLIDNHFDRNEIRSFFQSRFDARKNYESFIKKLIAIK